MKDDVTRLWRRALVFLFAKEKKKQLPVQLRPVVVELVGTTTNRTPTDELSQIDVTREYAASVTVLSLAGGAKAAGLSTIQASGSA